MKICILLIPLLIVCQFVLGQVVSTANSKTNAQEYREVIETAEHAWKTEPTKHIAYLLAIAYFNLGDINNAIKYAQIVLENKTIKQGAPLNSVQLKRMDKLANGYNGGSSGSSGVDGFRPDQNPVFQSGSLVNSVGQNTKDVDLQRAILAKNDSIFEIQKKGVSTINKPLIYDNSQKSNSFESNTSNTAKSNIYHVSWIDSSHKIKRFLKKSFYGTQSLIYDEDHYPELYQQREFVLPDFIGIFMSYQKGQLNPEDEKVKYYGLNRYNILTFYELIFPEIISNRNNLQEYQDEFKLRL